MSTVSEVQLPEMASALSDDDDFRIDFDKDHETIPLQPLNYQSTKECEPVSSLLVDDSDVSDSEETRDQYDISYAF